MHMFYRVIKGIYQFAANLLSYISTKYYWSRSTSGLVIVKSKRVNFFWNTVYMQRYNAVFIAAVRTNYLAAARRGVTVASSH